MMELTTLSKIHDRMMELHGRDRFPTSYDALRSWIESVNEVVDDIEKKSLNQEDRTLRGQQLIERLLS